jgi:hypothetical protein
MAGECDPLRIVLITFKVVMINLNCNERGHHDSSETK